MIRQLAHVCLNVRDLAATRRFYGEVLGLPEQFTFERDGEMFGLYFRLGNDTFLEAFENADATATNRGITHFCLETEDPDGLLARLEEHGVEHSAKVMGADHAWQFWLKDPDGNDIEIHTYTDRSMQRQGGVVREG